jgi:hypothetical protein
MITVGPIEVLIVLIIAVIPIVVWIVGLALQGFTVHQAQSIVKGMRNGAL